MEGLFQIVSKINRVFGIVTKCSLGFIILITVADVILRSFRLPIIGTYELVTFSGAVAIGFSIPITSWAHGHIQVDFLVSKLSRFKQKIITAATKSLGTGLFLLIGYTMIVLGNSLRTAGEVSYTLSFPIYPVAYGLGACSFLQSLVLLCDILKLLGEKDG
jgi:TRAP-type C4-dicarboxylate transport system permease small subunit